MKKFATFLKDDESGATLVEYAAALGVVLLTGIVAFNNLGGQANTNFGNAATAITPA